MAHGCARPRHSRYGAGGTFGRTGRTFVCEVFVEDFGSPNGAVVVSQKTERRVRQYIRSLGHDLGYCVEPVRRLRAVYHRKHHVEALRDWGWFGSAGGEPGWYHSDHA